MKKSVIYWVPVSILMILAGWSPVLAVQECNKLKISVNEGFIIGPVICEYGEEKNREGGNNPTWVRIGQKEGEAARGPSCEVHFFKKGDPAGEDDIPYSIYQLGQNWCFLAAGDINVDRTGSNTPEAVSIKRKKGCFDTWFTTGREGKLEMTFE